MGGPSHQPVRQAHDDSVPARLTGSLDQPMQDRGLILEMLGSYRPIDAADHRTHQRFIQFVGTYPNCFERSLLIGHITGSVWLVNQAMDCVLLTHHRKLDQWFQLGGHSDGDNNPLNVALREAAEESGIPNIKALSSKILDLDIHLIPARHSEQAHDHFDVRFALQTVGTDDVVVSAESKELRWIKIDDLHNFTQAESLLRMRSKWYELRKSFS